MCISGGSASTAEGVCGSPSLNQSCCGILYSNRLCSLQGRGSLQAGSRSGEARTCRAACLEDQGCHTRTGRRSAPMFHWNSRTRLLARLACDMQKPDGLVVLHPHEMPAPILQLRLQDISGICPNMLARLHRASIYDMHQLWAADAERLKRIWGSINGLRLHASLNGISIEEAKTTSCSMSHQHVLAPEQRSIEAATSVVRELCIRVAQRLRNESFFCWRLDHEIK